VAVARRSGARHGGAKVETVHGFNVRHWAQDGLDFWAVSDINAGELEDFGEKFMVALHPS